MAATDLFAGDAAIVTYNADDGSLTILFRKPVGSGTTLYLTDRTWNGSAFLAGAGDGTISIIVGPLDFPAGLAVTFTAAQLASGGIDLSTLGETLYLYQGADPDTPSRFVFALEAGDGDSDFDGSLAGTGLTEGLHTVALASDNAAFAGRLGAVQARLLSERLGDPDGWIQNDTAPQPSIPTFTLALDAPDTQLWVAGLGGGDALVSADADPDATAMLPGTLAYRVLDHLQNDPGASALLGPRDVTLDTVHDRFFLVDSDGSTHRILQGSISDLLAHPGAPVDLTILYQTDEDAADITSLAVDIENGKIYFGENTRVVRIDFDTAGQTGTVLADLFDPAPPPEFGVPLVQQIAIDADSGTLWVATTDLRRVGSDDYIGNNQLLSATAVTAAGLASAAADSLTFAPVLFVENDATFGDQDTEPNLGLTHWPKAKGALVGIDVDPATGIVYFAARTVVLDTSTAQDNSELTTFYGGVYSYDPVTTAMTALFVQDGTNGPTGGLSYIDYDPVTDQYYVTEAGSGVWRGDASAPGVPLLFAQVANAAGLGPAGLEVQHAPTLAGVDDAPSQTEEAGYPSPDPVAVQPASGFAADDADSGGALAGAQVRIADGFLSGAGHQDVLTINGGQSGTLTFGADEIDYSYDPATGVLTLTGVSTFANYEAALELVRFQATGDNPTAGGASTTRTVAYALFDGLLYSDEVLGTVTVTAVDDLPVARDDEDSTDEATVATGNVLDDNGNGPDDPDGPTPVVAEVNGSSADVGNPIPLSSGAMLTLNADGSYSYDPNGAFDYLITAADAAATGAVNDSATDSFTYTLASGGSATVTITITGLASAGDELRGDSGDNVIADTIGLDLFRLDQGGDDTASGQSGGDVFEFGDAFDEFDSIDGGAGTDELRLAGDYWTVPIFFLPTTLSNVERIVLAGGFSYDLTIDDANLGAGQHLTVDGSALAPTEELWFDGSDESNARFLLIGGGCDDVLIGGGGRDTLIGNTGFNYLDGFGGIDTVDYSGAGGAVDVDLGDEFASDNGYGQFDILVDIENAIGSAFDDLIFGSGVANRLEGGAGADQLQSLAGNDWLDGGSGADVMLGGADDDTYIVDDAGDQLVELDGGGTDLVRSLVTFVLPAHVENLTLTGAAAVNATGNALANVLKGNGQANVLDGGAGADEMRGAGGGDTYVVNDPGDRVIETSQGPAIDTVQSSIGYTLGLYLENLTLTGAAAIDGTGNSADNAITGNSAANLLSGGGGDDALSGAGGGDTLAGGDGDDTLAGGDGDDTLSGGRGNDSLEGGSGADGFRFDRPLDAAANVDAILDFNPAEDTIFLLRNNLFSALPKGALAAAAFRQGDTALDGDDRILYDSATGEIFYDADGSGVGAAILFATVDPGTALTAADFVVY